VSVVVVVLVAGFAAGGLLSTAAAALGEGRSLHVDPPKVVAEVVPVPVVRATPSSVATGSAPSPVAVRPAASSAPVVAVPVVGAPAAPPGLSHTGKPLPAASGIGRRIVYQQSTMHLWVVESDGRVVRDYAVTGRPGWPLVGTYHVFSTSSATVSPKYHVTFDWMVRFAHGHSLDIGFHDIPRSMSTGIPIQSEVALGAPVGHGGCVRQRTVDAKWLYGWATIGTTVVVLR
jgi:lipoprotein-anchoring transpeptidase ErfK/SrfK